MNVTILGCGQAQRIEPTPLSGRYPVCTLLLSNRVNSTYWKVSIASMLKLFGVKMFTLFTWYSPQSCFQTYMQLCPVCPKHMAWDALWCQGVSQDADRSTLHTSVCTSWRLGTASVELLLRLQGHIVTSSFVICWSGAELSWIKEY
jgi:hypothetical protein